MKIGFLGIKCKNENFYKLNLKENWDFEELFESLGFLRKIRLRKSRIWELKIVSYLRHGNYESWCIKIGDLRNHSKADFIEIMNKMIMVMIMISSGINTRIGAWETEN